MLTVTATNLPRLMVCNGSRLVGGLEPSTGGDTTVRDEGDAAHWLVGQVHSGQFTAEELVDRKAPNGVYITPEMVEYLEAYLEIVVAGGQIELDTSHGSNTGWQINGRADHVFYNERERHLFVSDLKYGWSIVEPEKNWTLISHACGFWFKHPGMSIADVTFTIYQPRPHHPAGRVRECTITGAELAELYNRINTVLSNPSDMLQTSEHCRNCPALATCPAANKAQMNALEASEKAFKDQIDNAGLSFEMDNIKRAIEILTQRKKAYEELAINRLRQGQIVANYGLENELTNRVWKEGVTPELVEMLTGKDLTKKQLITPKQVEKAGVSEKVVASLCERRNKGVKLVRMDANARAEKLFKTTEKGN